MTFGALTPGTGVKVNFEQVTRAGPEGRTVLLADAAYAPAPLPIPIVTKTAAAATILIRRDDLSGCTTCSFQ